MRRWALQHPSGTTLRVRYDPQHPDAAVPDAIELPGSGAQASDDLKATLVFSILCLIVISIDRSLQGRTGAQETNGPEAAG